MIHGCLARRGFDSSIYHEAIMKFLVTGSAGHLGEALVRTLRDLDHEVVGLDILESPFTTYIGSIADRSVAMQCMKGVQVVFHAATLHNPHIATHSRQEFIDTNITGTLNLLEAAVSAGVQILCLHKHNQCVWRRSGASSRRSRSVDHGRCHAGTKKHLWRNEDCR